MISYITKPTVVVLGASRMFPQALKSYVAKHGLASVASDPDTPLFDLIKAIEESPDDAHLDRLAEFAGRTCYRSWSKGRPHDEYIENVLRQAHGNLFAHPTVHLAISGISRSLSHELVRHHVGTNPSQESQRFVMVDGGETAFVIPPLLLDALALPKDFAAWPLDDQCTFFAESEVFRPFALSCEAAILHYDLMVDRLRKAFPDCGKKRIAEAARSVLPNAVETQLFFTLNLRALRNILEQRGDLAADLEFRRLAAQIIVAVKPHAPSILDDVAVDTGYDSHPIVTTKYRKV